MKKLKVVTIAGTRPEKVLDCLVAVRKNWNMPVMVSTHPRTRNRFSLEALSRDELGGITFHEPFGYLDCNNLQLNAKSVISDFDTTSEETSLMGFSAVTLTSSMQRLEALESGSIIMTGVNPDNLLRSIGL